MKKNKLSISDKIAWLLTVCLLSSFIVLNNNEFSTPVLIVLTFSILLITMYQKRNILKFKIPTHYFIGLMLVCYCFLSSFWAVNMNIAIQRGVTIFEILICAFIIEFHFSKYSSIDMFLDAIKWAGFVVSLYTVKIYSVYEIKQVLLNGRRLPGTLTNVNSIAMLSAISIVIFFYFFILGRKDTILQIPFALSSIIVILACGSRKALVMLILGVMMLLLYRFKRKHLVTTVLQWVIVLLIFIIIVKFLSSFPIFLGINKRMDGLLALLRKNGEVDQSSQLRILFIKTGIKQFFDTPILGVGMGGSGVITQELLGETTYLHNNYVELLATGGIVGFSIYYAIYGYLILALTKVGKVKDDSQTILCLILLAILLINDYGLVSYYLKITYFYFVISSLKIKKAKERCYL